MLFHIHCQDKPGSSDVRAANRPDHLEYLKSFGAKLRLAGPTIADDGETVTGSILIIEADDMAGAEDFAAGDPYAKAGLFQSTAINPIRITIPAD